MKHLHIDIETYCDTDLSDVGVYRYVEDESFRVLLIAYSFDGGYVTVVDSPPPGSAPAEFIQALTDPSVLKIAHNANFEMVCLSRYYGLDLDPAQWFCTMVGAAYLGLPLKLEKVAEVLRLTEQKDARGKTLITYFCKPCKPTKKNGGRTVNRPVDDPEKWGEFKRYNAQDVRTEREVFEYISRFPGLPAEERRYWELDQKVNANGITVDRPFVEAAVAATQKFTKDALDEMANLTGLDNPNSLTQLKKWLADEMGHTEAGFSLNKEAVDDYINSGDKRIPDHVLQALRLRRLTSNTSLSKYGTMLSCMQRDGRIRGLVQFYGANRTGRYSGRGVQVHNLKRTLKKGLDTARQAVGKGIADLLYDDVPGVISKLTRTALIASPGKRLAVSDFASIEARVIAWLAGEEWVLEVFRTHGKIYEATAANMFGVPLEMVTKGSDLRAKGKISTLALGYQGGTGALIQMGALREGLVEAELPALVRDWRAANPKIVKLWRLVEQAARHVITNRKSHTLKLPFCELKFSWDRGYLFIQLPGGRRLAYYGAAVSKGRLTYWGVNQTTKTWCLQETYGGSLVENITQAIARDCLCDAMERMDAAGITVLMHVHDEVVSEDEDAEATLWQMNNIMSVSPAWAQGLPLQGDGYTSSYYKKD